MALCVCWLCKWIKYALTQKSQLLQTSLHWEFTETSLLLFWLFVQPKDEKDLRNICGCWSKPGTPLCVCVLSLFVLIYKLPVFCHSLRVLLLLSFHRVPSLISSSVCLPLCLSAVLFMRRSTSTGWLSCWRSWGGMWGPLSLRHTFTFCSVIADAFSLSDWDLRATAELNSTLLSCCGFVDVTMRIFFNVFNSIRQAGVSFF